MNIDIIEHKGEKVYLKKDWAGWRTVEPITDPETKKFRWRGFLNKRGFILLIFIIILLSCSYLAFKEQLTNYKLVTQSPCKFCTECQTHCRDLLNNYADNQYKNLGGSINITFVRNESS